MATCRACGATIKFIRTERGRQMPVDVPAVTVITSLGKTIKAFTPHWISCPQAQKFKKAQA